MPRNRYTYSVRKGIELIQPHLILAEEGIDGAAIGTTECPPLVLKKVASADEADFVVNTFVRTEREHAAADERFQVFEGIFIAGRDAHARSLYSVRVKADGEGIVRHIFFGKIGAQADDGGLLGTRLCALHQHGDLFLIRIEYDV